MSMAQDKPKNVSEVVPSLSYSQHHATLVSYLLAKVALGDWHAVWDAAIDLKTIEAEENARNQNQGCPMETP